MRDLGAKTLALAVLLLGACSSGAASPDAGAGDAKPAVDGQPAPALDAAAGPDQAPEESGSAPSDADAAVASGWPVVTDYGARGPFAITRESNTGPNGAYDVFRPAELGGGKRKHPVISWANGTLYDIASYQKLLEHWASHGFLVICAQTNSTAGGGTHKAGIDWMVAENGRTGSAYFGVVDTTRVGAAGHSQGGGATIAAGSNKPGPTGIVATLPLMPLLSFESDKGIVMRQTALMLNINATMDNRDPTGAVANQIFAGAQRELVQAAYRGIHEDAMSEAMLRPALAWFRLQLMGDESARALFYPAGSCGLCQDPAWKEVRYRN